MKNVKWAKAIPALIVIGLFLANILLGILLTGQSSAALTYIIQNRMLDISNTAAAMLDGDSLSRLTADDADTEEYRKVMETLTFFQDNIELKYIYCIQDLGDGNFAFSVDPTVDDPGEFGSPIVYTDALFQASLGTPAVDSEPYIDAWGSFYSAYSPVFTSSGEVGGIVAVDFSADWYNHQHSQFIRTVVCIGAASLLIGILMERIITHRNREQYRTLYRQLNALAGKIEELVREIENGTILSIPERQAIQNAMEEIQEGEDIDALGAKIASMQDSLREHIVHVHEQMYLDTQTGVGNKAAYMEFVRHLDRMIQEGIASFTVAVFDLNGLKEINDTFGHQYGDKALTDMAEVLKAVFGKELLYRIGGDEFIAIVKKSTAQEMKLFFSKLDDGVNEANKTPRPYKFPLAMSKGAAEYVPGEDRDFQSVFRRADVAMYDDKKAYYTKHGDRRRR